jgi:hypothetical protein
MLTILMMVMGLMMLMTMLMTMTLSTPMTIIYLELMIRMMSSFRIIYDAMMTTTLDYGSGECHTCV